MEAIEQTYMSTNDMLAIVRVFERLGDDVVSTFNLVAVIKSLKRFDSIDDEQYWFLLNTYVRYRGTPANKIYSFAKNICRKVSFFNFVQAINDAGYSDLCQQLQVERERHYTVNRGVQRRELPNADKLLTYYSCLKRSADNNLFDNRAKVLKGFVSSLAWQIVHCEDLNKKQFLVDKRSIVYFLLCQLCPNINRRNRILMKMRDSMPRDVSLDRTVFDTVFHGYMALNWAIKDNETTAEYHEKRAREACYSCVPGFVTIVMSQWIQYKNNALYLNGGCTDKVHVERSSADFDIIQQCLGTCSELDQLMWRTISIIDMARSLLGIDLYLNVCDIEQISQENIGKARRMLCHLSAPNDVRRKMYYLIIQGRLQEQNDPAKAKKSIEEALSVASDGCYYEVEKENIRKYLDRIGLPPSSVTQAMTIYDRREAAGLTVGSDDGLPRPSL